MLSLKPAEFLTANNNGRCAGTMDGAVWVVLAPDVPRGAYLMLTLKWWFWEEFQRSNQSRSGRYYAYEIYIYTYNIITMYINDTICMNISYLQYLFLYFKSYNTGSWFLKTFWNPDLWGRSNLTCIFFRGVGKNHQLVMSFWSLRWEEWWLNFWTRFLSWFSTLLAAFHS